MAMLHEKADASLCLRAIGRFSKTDGRWLSPLDKETSVRCLGRGMAELRLKRGLPFSRKWGDGPDSAVVASGDVSRQNDGLPRFIQGGVPLSRLYSLPK